MGKVFNYDYGEFVDEPEVYPPTLYTATGEFDILSSLRYGLPAGITYRIWAVKGRYNEPILCQYLRDGKPICPNSLYGMYEECRDYDKNGMCQQMEFILDVMRKLPIHEFSKHVRCPFVHFSHFCIKDFSTNEIITKIPFPLIWYEGRSALDTFAELEVMGLEYTPIEARYVTEEDPYFNIDPESIARLGYRKKSIEKWRSVPHFIEAPLALMGIKDGELRFVDPEYSDLGVDLDFTGVVELYHEHSVTFLCGISEMALSAKQQMRKIKGRYIDIDYGRDDDIDLDEFEEEDDW